MIEPATIPNLGPNERGYSTGDADWPLARVRITPVQNDPAIAAAVNGPVVTAQIVVQISASLVDADGQVLRIGGRLLVQEASRHSWAFGGPVPLDVDAWLDGVVAGEVTRLIGAARDLAAADAAGMLAPADAVPPPGSNAQLVNPAVAAEMAAMSAPVIMEAGDADG